MSDFDVAIVGGGPAGLTLALNLAPHGCKIAVVEPKAYPIDKPCGEGIMPEGVKQLERLKILPLLDQSQISPFAGVSLINAQGQRATSFFNGVFGLGCRRLELSRALYTRCLDFKNINFINTKARALHKTSTKMILSTDLSKIHARLVVGADGLRSLLRSWAGLSGPPSKSRRYGLRQHYLLKPHNNLVEVYFNHGIEAYITPAGPKQTNIAFLWTKDLLTKKLEKIDFAHLLELFPTLKERIADAPVLSSEMAIGPLEQKCTQVISDGVALIGDASGYLDAITGEGNSLAFAQAEVLASVIKLALKKDPALIIKRDLAPYASAHKKIVSSYYRNTRLMLWLAKRPRLFSAFISFAAISPQKFSWFINTIRSKTPELIHKYT